MGKKTGRTPKVSSEEKLAIVDRYFITSTDGNAAPLRKHGIYRNLSDYAKSLHYSLEPYDFSRDDSVRNHIEQLITNSSKDTHTVSGLPSYEPLDVTALMMTGRANIEKTIRDREEYFVSLHCRAAKAIENYVSVSQLCTQYQVEVAAVKRENEQLRTQCETLVVELRTALRDISYLKRIIRKDVESERAQQFLEGLTSREAVIEKVSPVVTSNIYNLTMEDQKAWTDAQKEIDMLDLSHLFK